MIAVAGLVLVGCAAVLLRDPQPLAEPIPMRGAQHWQEVDV
jgi:hypothetical protein